MKIIDCKKELCDSSIFELFELATAYAPIGLFVVRNGLEFNSNCDLFLNKMKPFIISEESVREWPGTELLDGVAKIFKFRVSKDAVEVFCSLVTRLSDFIQPNFPEDLCFLREDNSAFFVSITHEDDFF